MHTFKLKKLFKAICRVLYCTMYMGCFFFVVANEFNNNVRSEAVRKAKNLQHYSAFGDLAALKNTGVSYTFFVWILLIFFLQIFLKISRN